MRNKTKRRDVELAKTAVRTAKAKINRLLKDDRILTTDSRWIAANQQYDEALAALTAAQYR